MNFVNKLKNKRFNLQQLADLCETDPKIVNKWRQFCSLHRQLAPKSYGNGRVNHIWIQEMIDDVSNGVIAYGGQGNSSADCYVDNQKTETKAYKSKDKKFHVAASSFFASNCKVPEWKRLGKTTPEAESFLFEHSYDKNENYLLTSTSKLDLDFDDIEVIFISKDTLVKCLNPSDKRTAVLSEINKKVRRL